jgi:aminoglycoside phosphotransferase (APT) family kinase protein
VSLERWTREYSPRLGVLSGAQLQAALQRFGLGELLHAAPAMGGRFGQNVFLTATSGEWVLRGHPLEDWQLPAERFFAGLIQRSSDVPVPWPCRIEVSRSLFGWPFAIVPRLPGESWALVSDGADALAIAGAAGRALARLHEVGWSHCGRYALALDSIEPLPGPYAGCIEASLEARLEAGLRDGFLTPADAAWCRAAFARDAAALGVPFAPSLVHHDFKRDNLLVERRAEAWRVSGVLDLGECRFGDGEEDLVRSLFDFGLAALDRHRALVSAWARVRPPRAGHRERFRIHALRDAVLLWSFDHRHGRPVAPGRSFREWAEPHLAYDPYST